MRDFQADTSIDCDQCTTMFPRYIEGKLDHIEKMRLEFHLSHCNGCSERLDDFIETKLDSCKIEPIKAPFYPPFDLYNLYQKYQGIIAVPQQTEVRTTERLLLRIAQDFSAWLTALFEVRPKRRLVIAVANPIGVKARIRLLEKAAEVMQDLGYQTAPLRVELLDTYLDVKEIERTASQKDKDRRAYFLLDATKFANLNEALAKTTGHIIAIGPLREWQATGKEAAPHRFYPIHISEDDRQSLRRTAVECYQTIAETSDVAEPVHLILALGAFGVLTPVSLLASAIKESAYKLIERLNTEQVSALVMPIHPSRDTAPDPAKVRFFTATSELMAAAALDSAGLFTEAVLVEIFSELIGAALADSDKSPDEKAVHTATVVRLLYSLVLNSQQRLAYNLIERHSDDLKALQDSTDNVRHLHSWAKIYRGIGYRQTNARAEELYERALQIKWENIYLLSAYATFLAEQRRYPEAKRHFRKIEELSGLDNIHVLTAWADMLLKWGRHLEDARKILEKACELEPGNPYPLQMLSLVEQKKVYFAPVEQAEDFQHGLDNAEAYLSQALEIDKDNIPSLHALGHLARERGHLQTSEKWLTKVLDLDSENVHAMVELGRLYTERAKDNTDKADRKATYYFHEVLELDDDNIHALTAWSDLDIKVERFEEAEHKLQKAVQLAAERNDPTAVIETTRVKLEMKRGIINEDRKMQVMQLLESLSKNVDPAVRLIACNLLVKILWMAGDKGMADRAFYKILRENITPRIVNNYAALLARDAGQQQDRDLFLKADNWYQRSLSCDSKNAYTHLGYALNLLNWADFEEDATRREKGKQAIYKASSLGLDIPEVQKAIKKLE